MEAIRLNGRTNSLEAVQEAFLERSGEISVILKTRANGRSG